MASVLSDVLRLIGGYSRCVQAAAIILSGITVAKRAGDGMGLLLGRTLASASRIRALIMPESRPKNRFPPDEGFCIFFRIILQGKLQVRPLP